MLQKSIIIIADAEEKSREAIAHKLREYGSTVKTASTGSGALRLIQKETADLLILDILVDRGEDLCHTIKTNEALKKIPIVVLTTLDDLKTKLRCLEIGVEEYLVKPVQTEELIARINRFFRLMKQWKTDPPRKSRSHTETTANLGNLTLPTINLPETHENSSQPPVVNTSQPRMEKTSYGVYKIESIAGTGGMGLVYKAHDESLDRPVAVKVLSREWSSSPEFAARFRTEAKLIAAINHPGIAQIYTFAEDGGESYFALQWCAGGSLASQIKNQGKMAILPSIDIIMQCSLALEAASYKSVVHRDIKPSNLMFDETHQVKIVDFGIASSEKMPEKSDSSAVIGSPAYMSPEQGRGSRTDHRTDIYSLGITFYQMIYGRLPFSAPSPQDYVEMHAKAPFPPYNDLNGTIPQKAYKIIERMTQKNPTLRYQTYSELTKDLERLRNELYSQRRLKVPVVSEMNSFPTLSNPSLFELLTTILNQKKSGILKLSWASLQKKFLVVNNNIVHFESPQPDENCWAVLANRKLMKKEDIPSEKEDFEESLNRLLFLRAFSLEDFKTIWRELMTQSLTQVFLWPVLDAEFFEGRIEHDPLVQIPMSKIIMTAARSMIPMDVIDQRIRSDQFLARTEQFEERRRNLNLSNDENFLISRVEGEGITPDTLQVLTGFPAEKIKRTVFALERTGVLKYQSAAERRPRHVAEKTAPRESMNIPAPQEAQQKISEVTEKRRKQPHQWVDAAPQPDKRLARSSYEQAKIRYQKEQLSDASRLVTQAIKNDPTCAEYHFLMAEILSHYKHSAKASVESYRKAVELEPRNVEYRIALVEALRRCSLFVDAYEECEQLLELSPHDRRVALLFRQVELEKQS